MNITFTEKARESPDQFLILQKTNPLLEEVFLQSSDPVEVQWDQTIDQDGRSLFVLHLKDSFGEVSGSFAPDELKSPNQMYFRLYRLLGDLIRAQTNRQLLAIASH